MEKWEANDTGAYSGFQTAASRAGAVLGPGGMPLPAISSNSWGRWSWLVGPCLSHIIPRCWEAKWKERRGSTPLFREKAEIKPEYSHQSHCWCLYKPRGWKLYMD